MKNKGIVVAALLAMLWVGCGTGSVQKVAFITTDSNGLVNGAYTLDSLYYRNVSKLPLTIPSDAFWIDISPDASKVAYCTFVGSGGQAAIFLLDERGVKQLTNGGNGGDCIPRFSRDGKLITFESLRDDPNFIQMYVMNADGSGQKRIITDAADDLFPMISPDGKTVAFFRWNSGSSASAKPALSYQDRWQEQRQKSFGPKGFARMSLQANAIATGDGLYTVNFDGTNPKQVLAIDTFYASSEVFSPDGKKLIFATTQFGNGSDVEIASINLDGSGIKNLSNNPGTWDYAPMVIGNTILFDRNGPDVDGSHGPADIYRMDLDGSHQVNLSNTPNQNEYLPNATDFPG